jgi:hypothetical protein
MDRRRQIALSLLVAGPNGLILGGFIRLVAVALTDRPMPPGTMPAAAVATVVVLVLAFAVAKRMPRARSAAPASPARRGAATLSTGGLVLLALAIVAALTAIVLPSALAAGLAMAAGVVLRLVILVAVVLRIDS